MPLTFSGEPQPLVRVPRLGFPLSMLSNIRYNDTYVLSITSGNLQKQNMRWNSVFDPDQTGTGHQPLYRDTFAAIYDQYAVVSAAASVTFVNTSSTPILVGLVTEDDTSSSTDHHVLIEQAQGLHRMLPSQSGSLSTHTFTHKWSAKRNLRIDPFKSETYKTAVGSNPSEESDLLIWGTTADGSSSATFAVDVTMVYEVLWTELSTPTLS